MFSRSSISDWTLTGFAVLTFAAVMGVFGVLTGLFTISITADYSALLRIAVIAFVLPAFVEELVFRGPLIWLADHGSSELPLAAALSLLLFVLWHPFNAALFLTDAREVFSDWRFLTAATMLGVVATWLALRTRSLWPPIVFHWIVVVGWKALLGGPAFL